MSVARSVRCISCIAPCDQQLFLHITFIVNILFISVKIITKTKWTNILSAVLGTVNPDLFISVHRSAPRLSTNVRMLRYEICKNIPENSCVETGSSRKENERTCTALRNEEGLQCDAFKYIVIIYKIVFSATEECFFQKSRTSPSRSVRKPDWSQVLGGRTFEFFGLFSYIWLLFNCFNYFIDKYFEAADEHGVDPTGTYKHTNLNKRVWWIWNVLLVFVSWRLWSPVGFQFLKMISKYDFEISNRI